MVLEELLVAIATETGTCHEVNILTEGESTQIIRIDDTMQHRVGLFETHDSRTRKNNLYLGVLVMYELQLFAPIGILEYLIDKESTSALLLELSHKLAQRMGVEVKVVHAKTEEDAKILSKSVITSNLVKAAVFGNDANWGRIFCALGYSGVQFNPETIDLYVESDAGKLQLAKDSLDTHYSEDLATEILKGKEVKVTVDMKAGSYEATAWGCDLTYDYVKINGDYRS